MTPLSGLTSLTDLDLGENSISDVSALSGLTAITTLSLFKNSITDISDLSALTDVTFLLLWNNAITDIGPLEGMTQLTWVYLSGNADLSNIQPLMDNAGLGTGDTVFLSGTAVDCSDVAALTAKGVTVYAACP